MDLSTPQMALDLIRRQHDLNFIPGSKFSYSDTNYLLLALVVERISGQSLADFAKHQIFEPLGMRQTHFRRNASSVTPLSASGYRKRSDGWHTGNSGSQVIDASGVFSTVTDLAKWDQNFYDKKVGGEATIKLMLEQRRLSDGSPNDYAMGLKNYRAID
jgi:CubicO group peptidase (beta-lactamase class C family)